MFSLFFSHVEIKSLATLSCPKLACGDRKVRGEVCVTLEVHFTKGIFERFGLRADCERTSALWKESEMVGSDHLNNF